MRWTGLIFTVVFISLGNWTEASPEAAARMQKRFEAEMQKWNAEMRAAVTPDAIQKATANRPDVVTLAREMWAEIGPSLAEEWALEPAAWFLRLTSELVAPGAGGSPALIFAKEQEAIFKAIEQHHMGSGKLISICSALSLGSNPRSLAILEKLQANHADKKIQGVAALSAAMRLRSLGDDGEIMKKRLSYIRKAIIESSDVELDGAAVSKLAENELHIIRYLTKGRVAPDLVGINSANQPLSLTAHKGKVIVLLFWNSNVPNAKEIVDFTNAMSTKFQGKPFVVIGVNNDSVEKLRALQADNTVPWPNFSDPENKLANEYRVGVWPLVYVLDGQRKIHYAGAPGSFVELTAEALIAEQKPTATQ